MSWLRRWRQTLFADVWQSLISVALLALILRWLPDLLGWALIHASWRPDVDACHAAADGACWGVIGEKYRLILFGRYPYAEHWRALLATLLMLALLGASAVPRCWHRALLPAWLTGVMAIAWLLLGSHGLMPVDGALIGGLPLSLMLAAASLIAALPLALLLALGRSSANPVLRLFCAAYIELARGLPLVAVLFMASFLLPLLLPQGLTLQVLLRVWIGLALFAAAYLAESIRGGLQAISPAQYDAARALGLGYWQMQRWVVLPQALRHALPALVNSCISTLKETSLITIVSLYELTGSLGLALSGSPQWRPFFLEGYLFIGLIYWLICFGMSGYSRWLERRLNGGVPAAVPV